ncbi:MAG: hypothetical protein GX234_04895 [Clostridiales bacterium]|nr:hypothetical protein [Clostridiales bacterium]
MPEHDECTNLEVFDRPEANWIKEPFRTILNSKLYETNSEYTELEKIWSYEKSVSKDILKQKRDLIAKQIEKKDWENVVITIDDVVRSDLFNLKEKWMKQMIIMYGYALFFSQSYQNVSSVYADFYEEFNNSTEYLLLLGKLYVKEEMLEKAIVIFHRVKELSTDEKEKENADQYIRALEEKVQ